MSKAKEDLIAIFDLLSEWREENGVRDVNMYILDDGKGIAYGRDGDKCEVNTGLRYYKPMTAKTPAVETARESR